MYHHSPVFSEVINPWKTLKAEVKYDNPWIRVSHEAVITPSGTEGIYGRVHFKNRAIGILPIDEDEHIHLIGQYRYPLDEYSWEIPEGGCPYHEDPLDAAKRELKEETGYMASEWMLLNEITTSNCISDERALIYVARRLKAGVAEPEETEELQHKKIPFREALELVRNGTIRDAISVAAILYYATFGEQVILP